MKSNRCECEHVCHSTDCNITDKPSPNGKMDNHYYGKIVDTLVSVQTLYGAFQVCLDCFEDCYNKKNLRKIHG